MDNEVLCVIIVIIVLINGESALNAFIISFEVIAPLMLLMAVGFVLKSTKLVSSSTFGAMNKLVFYLGIPALVFCSIIDADFNIKELAPFALWVMAAYLICFGVLMAIVPIFEKDNLRRGVIVSGMFRSNDAVFGFAVFAAFAGVLDNAVMTLAVALSVPTFNILGVLSLEIFRSKRLKLGRLLLDIIKNPIIVAVILGFIVNLLGIKLPKIVLSPIKQLSQLCTPLAFLILGGIITLKSVRGNRKALFWVSLIKLLVLPALAVGIAILMGFRSSELMSIMILFASPTAMSTFPLALAMGADGDLAGEQVAVTTALSLFTVFIFLTLLQLGGLI